LQGGKGFVRRNGKREVGKPRAMAPAGTEDISDLAKREKPKRRKTNRPQMKFCNGGLAEGCQFDGQRAIEGKKKTSPNKVRGVANRNFLGNKARAPVGLKKNHKEGSRAREKKKNKRGST